MQREPVCGQYRAYRVCGMGPPSSGGIAVVQTLGILDRFGLTRFAETLDAVVKQEVLGQFSYRFVTAPAGTLVEAFSRAVRSIQSIAAP